MLNIILFIIFFFKWGVGKTYKLFCVIFFTVILKDLFLNAVPRNMCQAIRQPYKDHKAIKWGEKKDRKITAVAFIDI